MFQFHVSSQGFNPPVSLGFYRRIVTSSFLLCSRCGPEPGPGVAGVPGGSGTVHGGAGALRQPLQGPRHDGDLLRHRRHHGNERRRGAGRPPQSVGAMETERNSNKMGVLEVPFYCICY